jgi:hypothetical protein
LRKRFAFAVARRWIGFSPCCPMRAAAFDTCVVVAVDCPKMRKSAACRLKDWPTVRLEASDKTALPTAIVCVIARKPSTGLICIVRAAIACADSFAAKSFS